MDGETAMGRAAAPKKCSIYFSQKKIFHIIFLPTPFLMNQALQGGGLMEVRVRMLEQR